MFYGVIVHPDYSDITDKLGEPLWWYRPDAAFPRYQEFLPELLGVYDDFAALVCIQCQACHRKFDVSVSYSNLRHDPATAKWRLTALPTARSGADFDAWGDPPIHGRCSGNTMMSDFVRIKQFWIKARDPRQHLEWARRPEYEFDYSAQLVGE